MRIATTCAVLLALMAPAALAQSTQQKLFEAGRYQEVVQATAPGAPPDALYLAAQSQQKLGANEQAVTLYQQLEQRPEGDPWHFIGQSGRDLIQGDLEGATAAARSAVQMAADLFEAHYQFGLVLARREDWAGAAAQFDAAVNINPSSAYAQYYDGLMQYRARRPDLMAIHFDQFLKLAPNAPERAEVTQIMRTVGR